MNNTLLSLSPDELNLLRALVAAAQESGMEEDGGPDMEQLAVKLAVGVRCYELQSD